MKNQSRKKQSRKKQLSFFNDKVNGEVSRLFGGSLLKGHAKRARPLNTKESIHLVLKSTQAIGPRSMLRPHNAKKIDGIIRQQAKQSGITIYHLVNVGNHLHLVVRITNLLLYDRFIRSVTGLIARHVTGRERGRGGSGRDEAEIGIETKVAPKETETSKLNRFWVARPFTRLIAWGRDYNYVKNYMSKNKHQAEPKKYFIAWGFETTDATRVQYLNTG